MDYNKTFTRTYTLSGKVNIQIFIVLGTRNQGRP